MKVVI